MKRASTTLREIRAVALLGIISACAITDSALAQICPYLDSDASRWSDFDSDLRDEHWRLEGLDWERWRAQLQQLQVALVGDQRIPLPARKGLSDLLVDVLGRFDGTRATANRLRLADFKPQPCPGADAEGLSDDASCAWRLPAAEVEIPNAGAAQAWECSTVRRFASYVQLIRGLLASVSDTFAAQAAATLQRAASAWKNYVLRGYSQYPWELFVNGLMEDDSDWTPDRFKLIVLHPSVGVLIGEPSGNAVVPLSGLLMLEALGFVQYNQQHDVYFGIGAGFSATSAQPKAISAAALLHLAGLHLGVSYGLTERVKADVGLFVTLDLTAGLDDGSIAAQAPKRVQGWLQAR